MVRQQLVLSVGEGATAAQEPHSFGCLEAEPAASSRHDVDNQLGVFPRLELRARDPYRHAVVADVEDREQDVAVPDDELTVGVTHRRGPVAAAAGLVEHQRPVARLQLPQQLGGRLGDQHPRGNLHEKNPRGWPSPRLGSRT
jgi:hypothetical protein